MRLRPLLRADLPRASVPLAKFLIGAVLVHDDGGLRRAGRIVETEAYPPGDQAAHAYIGPTARNASLFLERGHAYVYLSYGIHWLFNVSAEREGIGGGVLVRALEPLAGLDRASNGPGRLTVAMSIDRRYDGIDLCTPGPLWLARIARPAASIDSSRRIGISKAVDRPWRFVERDNPYASR